MDIPVTIVIPAAGLGTRMKSKQAKVLHRAGGSTLIEHVVNTALELTAPERIFVVVGHQADQVQATVQDRRVRFVHQTEQKGTGHAVMVCREAVAKTEGLLVVLYGDIPLLSAATLRRLIEQQRQKRAAVTVIIVTPAETFPLWWNRRLPRRNSSPSAKSTPASTALTPVCSGSTSRRSSRTIRRESTI
jgi:bifunctional UDP-N-acetylglucosamine pyrophosphorylase/glucosamine-1-phosphate N-acetyltransferase